MAIEEGACFVGVANAGTDTPSAQLVKLQRVVNTSARVGRAT
jgi:hypothetical protein